MPFTLEVVKIKSKVVPWAIKATMDGISRYRFYHYKAEAEYGMDEWEDYEPMFFQREFVHNFFPLGDLKEG